MTETTTETDERLTLVRSYEAEVAAGDGRTLDLRVIPYNVVAVVADPPDFRPYREAFLPGAFERQAAAPDRVRMWLNFEHDQGLRGIVGHGVELADSRHDLRGSFRVHENPDGDKALQLVGEKLLTGVSVEFHALRSRIVDGVTQRVRAHIKNVSLCRTPAYAGAEVLAVREQPEPELELHDEPAAAAAAMTRDLADRLAALGIEPMLRIAKTSKPWDGSPARFDDAQYGRSTLFCRPGDGPVKERCSLPVLEPDGTLNVNALGAAAGALAGGRGGLANVSGSLKATAARKLIRYYGMAGKPVPPSLTMMARG